MSFSENLPFHIYSNFGILFLGILASCYGLYVEICSESDPDYTAMCDLNRIISCTKVMNSEYCTGFGIIGPILGEHHFLNLSNAFYGVIGYFSLSILQFFELLHPKVFMSLSVNIGILLNLLSVYLFFILLHLRAFCIVCFTTYLVNASFLYLAIRRRQLRNSKPKLQ